MLIEKIDNRVYFKSEILSKEKQIAHAFTTKCGGESSGKICGLNLGFRCGDDPVNVVRNYEHCARDMGFPYEKITAARQTHSTNIRVITEDDAGKGVSRESDIVETDGIVTNCTQIPLVIFYADCVPILLFDKECGVVAAVHSGWRGTVGRISENAIGIMRERFGTKPQNIKAAVGPSIGPCCFECGEDVAGMFASEFVSEAENGKFKVDLWKANISILKDCGLKDENIDCFNFCTSCNGDLLYSYRRDREATGRMGAFIMLK